MEGRSVESIFFGGGTPSLFSALQMQRLLEALRASLTLAEDVEITLESGVLTITGERFIQAEKAEENVVRRRTERGTGRFYRRFILPESVDAEKVRATDRHGVLEILIPKQAKAMPRRIKVAA